MIRFLIATAAAALLTASSARAEGRYALVVGVEKYDESELAQLDWAEDDAEAIGKALEKLGFSVVTMTSASPVAARRPVLPADILTQLDKRLADREKSDTVVVALSGHGVQFKADRADAANAKELWFCPERARPADKSTLLPLTEVLQRLDACRASRKLLLVDACRNDFEPPNGSKSSRVIELPAAAVKRPPIPAGMVAVFSCRPGEQSFEIKALGHSIFSHHVIEFLEGRAPVDRYPRGEVGISELTSYVRTRTRDTAEVKLDRVQMPDVIVPDRAFAEWPLGSLAARIPGGDGAAGRRFRHDAAESARRREMARRILARDVSKAAPGDEEPAVREMLAWVHASLGDRDGTLRYLSPPKKPAGGDAHPTNVGEFDCIAAGRTLGLLKQRNPEADVTAKARELLEQPGRLTEAGERESLERKLNWALLDADDFLPETPPVEQERLLALAVDGIGSRDCWQLLVANPLHFAMVVPRERMAALVKRYAAHNPLPADSTAEGATAIRTTTLLLAAFAADTDVVDRLRRLDDRSFYLTAQGDVVPFAIRGDADRVIQMIRGQDAYRARLPLAINAFIDGGHVALARRLLDTVDSPESLEDGFMTYDPAYRMLPGIGQGAPCSGPYKTASRTLGRLGEEARCRTMLDQRRKTEGSTQQEQNLQWLYFVDGLLADCEIASE